MRYNMRYLYILIIYFMHNISSNMDKIMNVTHFSHTNFTHNLFISITF